MTNPRNLKSVVVEGTSADLVVSETPNGQVRIEVVYGQTDNTQLYFTLDDANNLIAALNAVLPVLEPAQ
jgi:hypothetical protein